MKATPLLLLPLAMMACLAHGRLVKVWTHEELAAGADAIAVIAAVNIEKTDLPLPADFPKGVAKENYQAWVTTCKVLAGFEGVVAEHKELRIVHFTYSDQINIVSNGAQFMKFTVGPVEREVETVENGRSEGRRSWKQLKPQWLAYLKRREDGRYEPVSGNYDATDSFKELTESRSAFR